jgi:mannonate dehydratase
MNVESSDCSTMDAARILRGGGVGMLRLLTSSVGGLTPARKPVALADPGNRTPGC